MFRSFIKKKKKNILIGSFIILVFAIDYFYSSIRLNINFELIFCIELQSDFMALCLV